MRYKIRERQMTPVFPGNHNYSNVICDLTSPSIDDLHNRPILHKARPDLFRAVGELINPGPENQLSGDNVSAGLPAS